MNKLNIETKYQITYDSTMKFRLFRILTIILSFIFLTGFVPILSFVGPGFTVLTSGNVYKASAQFIVNQHIEKETGKNSIALIKDTLIDYCDHKECALILTTGGTGPAVRDITPEATLSIADKEMPGFGEQMRQISLNFVPTSILSRQVAVIRKKTLIVNLPGQPKAIVETLEGVKDKENNVKTHGIFAAIPYCLDLIGGPYIETNEEFVKSFRPKKK